jgi:hypothetical protein
MQKNNALEAFKNEVAVGDLPRRLIKKDGS